MYTPNFINVQDLNFFMIRKEFRDLGSNFIPDLGIFSFPRFVYFNL